MLNKPLFLLQDRRDFAHNLWPLPEDTSACLLVDENRKKNKLRRHSVCFLPKKHLREEAAFSSGFECPWTLYELLRAVNFPHPTLEKILFSDNGDGSFVCSTLFSIFVCTSDVDCLWNLIPRVLGYFVRRRMHTEQLSIKFSHRKTHQR